MDFISLALLTFFASFVGTVTGFGSSTLMVPVVALFFPLPQTLLFVGIIHIANDIWKVVLFKRGINWKLILNFGIPGVLTSIMGSYFISISPPESVYFFFGAFLLLYAFLTLTAHEIKIKKNTFSLRIGGLFSGLSAGLLGMGGPVRTVVLESYNLKKEMHLFVSGLTAFFIDFPRLITYVANGVTIPQSLFMFLIPLIFISFVSAEVGKLFVEHISRRQFHIIIALFLGSIGFYYLFF